MLDPNNRFFRFQRGYIAPLLIISGVTSAYAKEFSEETPREAVHRMMQSVKSAGTLTALAQEVDCAEVLGTPMAKEHKLSTETECRAYVAQLLKEPLKFFDIDKLADEVSSVAAEKFQIPKEQIMASISQQQILEQLKASAKDSVAKVTQGRVGIGEEKIEGDRATVKVLLEGASAKDVSKLKLRRVAGRWFLSLPDLPKNEFFAPYVEE